MQTLARRARPWHRRVSALVALPFLITISTGLLLMTRGFNPWVQPAVPKRPGPPTLTFEHVLDAARRAPAAGVRSWRDVKRVDLRPDAGVVRVQTKAGWEVQLDAATGELLGGGPNRASLLTSLHEGAFFGAFVRYGIFGASALGALGLWLTGVVLYLSSAGASGRRRAGRGRPFGPGGRPGASNLS